MEIQVIIPVLNEEKEISKIVSELRSRIFNFENTKVLFVDGGSTDHTVQFIRSLKETVIVSPNKGRAEQMNFGAKNSDSDIYYFLHVDSIPPKNFDLKIREACVSGVDSGCFRMKFDIDHWLLNVSGWLTRFSYNICRGGDQSLFINRELFSKINGFDKNCIIMEDTDIIRRIKTNGTFKVLVDYIITSARRYRENGVVYLQYTFGKIHLKRKFGASQEELLSYYKRKVK